MFYTLLSLVLSYRFALFTLSPKTCFLVAYLVVSSLYSQLHFLLPFSLCLLGLSTSKEE